MKHEAIILTAEQAGNILIGDKVRSFDFEHISDCYLEGVVTGYTEIEGCHRYVIKSSSRTVSGNRMNIDGDFYPPVNGTPAPFCSSGFTDFVSKIESSN